MTYTKLIERMRTDSAFDFTTLGNEAADAIEALQAENERLAHANNALKLAVSGLQAKLDELQRQEPVGFISAECMSKLQDPEWQELRGEPLNLWTVNNPPSRAKTPLYAAPKAMEPQPDDSDVNQVHEGNAQVTYAPIFYGASAPKEPTP